MKWKSKLIRESHDYVGTPTYRSWYNMKSRCNNPNYRNSHLWLGRGIKYPPRWELFTEFLKDMGERPDGKSLDRINNDKSYSKDNCRWATREEQANNVTTNRRITFNNRTQTISQWARELGIKRETIRDRIDRYGWPIEKVLTTKVREHADYNKR